MDAKIGEWVEVATASCWSIQLTLKMPAVVVKRGKIISGHLIVICRALVPGFCFSVRYIDSFRYHIRYLSGFRSERS